MTRKLPSPVATSSARRKTKSAPVRPTVVKALAGALRGSVKSIRVRVVQLPHGQDLPLPAYQTDGAAGMDLVAALPTTGPLRLKRFQRALVPTGLILELPRNIEGQVRPRSGLALRHGVTVLNAPGTIDSDYRGEVQVLLINLGAGVFTIQRGDRIAQLVIQSVVRGTLVVVATTRSSDRAAGGFGSTGVKSPSKVEKNISKKGIASRKKSKSKKIKP
jgi:dUTP pyrophosphatase